ncbi:hypothetical protein [Glaciimonas soli]|uniref:Uncharacterized protein n=1 Tax=Glaciimonas soli TaxID=2590999 RepID=A0A843YKT6_9BURK|nr:hypothetical protein [Glaciimonas soli]MQR00459.1 hypothetical protein [Glaciimonas soli]
MTISPYTPHDTRKTWISIAVTVLLHVVLLFLVLTQADKIVVQMRPEPSDALNITFIQETSPSSAVHKTQARPPTTKSASKPKVAKVTPKVRPSPVIARTKPTPTPPQEKPVEPPPIAKVSPDMDMSTMIEAARAKRRAAAGLTENETPDDNGSNGQAPAADNAVALANINFLTHRGGGGGVFQIIHKGTSSAQYAFNGWGGTARENRRQYIDVQAGPDGNLEIAIIRSMIELIRKRYQGDFQWDSQRLGKVITLSARPTDQAGLESFMMREFFGGSAR